MPSTVGSPPERMTPTAASSVGNVRRGNQARTRIPAANRQATTSAPSDESSPVLIAVEGTHGAPSPNHISGGHRRRLGANPRLGPYIDLVELQLGQAISLGELAHVRPDDREDEADWDCDDADVLQRERWVRHGRKRPAGAGRDQPDGDDGPAYQPGNSAPRVESLPEQREEDGRQG